MLEKQKLEAIRRLEVLNLHPNVLKDFKEGKINVSRQSILFWANEEEQKMISDFEKEYDNLIYHVIYTNTTIGQLYSFFYISQNEEEWEMDMNDIAEGYAFVYVKNIEAEDCSEYGSISFKVENGGMARIG